MLNVLMLFQNSADSMRHLAQYSYQEVIDNDCQRLREYGQPTVIHNLHY